MADGVVLSPAEYRLFKEMTAAYRQRKAAGPLGRGGIDAGHDAAQAPDEWVGLTTTAVTRLELDTGTGSIVYTGTGTGVGEGPPFGTEPGGGNTPGEGTVRLYRVVRTAYAPYRPNLVPVGDRAVKVLNKNRYAIPAGRWVSVWKDKFGDLWAEGGLEFAGC